MGHFRFYNRRKEHYHYHLAQSFQFKTLLFSHRLLFTKQNNTNIYIICAGW